MQDQPQTFRHLATAAGALALLGAGMWLANQGGLAPQSVGKFAGTIVIAFGALPVLASLWVGAAGWGAVVRHLLARDVRHLLTVQAGCGLATMFLIDWALAWAGLLNANTAWLVCAVGFFFFAWQLADPKKRQRLSPETWPSPPWSLLLALPAMGLLLVACTCPPGTVWSVQQFGYDVKSHHLHLPAQWLQTGGMRGLEYDVGSYLPALGEAGYAQLMAMTGSVLGSVYSAQLMHASAAVLTTVMLAILLSQFVGPVAAVIGGMSLLVVPWTVIAASQAGTTMFALLFGVTALFVAFDPVSARWRGAALAGAMVGAAALVDLSMTVMLALPVVCLIALRLNPTARWPKAPTGPQAAALGGVALAAALTVAAPYLVRNSLWTSNPVFPFAADTLGGGHWSDEQVERWSLSRTPAPTGEALGMLGPRWATSPGYGAIGGTLLDRELLQAKGPNPTGGLPLLAVVALAGAVVGLRRAGDRRLTIAMLMMLAVQLAAWVLVGTQLPETLLPTLIPLCALVGLAMGQVERAMGPKRVGTYALITLALFMPLTGIAMTTFFGQTHRAAGRNRSVPTWECVDSLIPVSSRIDLWKGQYRQVGDHAINHLPPRAKVLLIADRRDLLYLRGRVGQRYAYQTEFDAGPLGQLWRKHKGDPAKVADGLRAAGFTHVWLSRTELDRLRLRGLFDPVLAKALPHQLLEAEGWRTDAHYADGTVLFGLYPLVDPDVSSDVLHRKRRQGGDGE